MALALCLAVIAWVVGPVRPCSPARSAEVRAYLGSILQLVLAIDDHRVPGVYATAQARVFIGGLRNGHGANLGHIIVIHGVNVSALWARWIAVTGTTVRLRLVSTSKCTFTN